MNSQLTLGRLDSGLVNGTKAVAFDAPEQTVRAILTKLDEVCDRLTAIGAAIELATDGPSLFTALDVAGTKAAVAKLLLTL
jgi:hypothetical protein